MQKFPGVKYQTSDQHKGLSLTRPQKDNHDGQKLFEYLVERTHFEIHTEFLNFHTGEIADHSVNIHMAYAIEKNIGPGNGRIFCI